MISTSVSYSEDPGSNLSLGNAGIIF